MWPVRARSAQRPLSWASLVTSTGSTTGLNAATTTQSSREKAFPAELRFAVSALTPTIQSVSPPSVTAARPLNSGVTPDSRITSASADWSASSGAATPNLPSGASNALIYRKKSERDFVCCACLPPCSGRFSTSSSEAEA